MMMPASVATLVDIAYDESPQEVVTLGIPAGENSILLEATAHYQPFLPFERRIYDLYFLDALPAVERQRFL